MNCRSIDKELLLEELVAVARLGPISSVGHGSNAVGKTLQKSLGIKHSTSTKNSKYGHTISASTQSTYATGRTNLFACVADWKESQIKSSTELAARFGKPNPERGYISSLFCTTNALQPNGFGLMLRADIGGQTLTEVHKTSGLCRALLSWDMQKIFGKLVRLGHTAIVFADCIKGRDGVISFQFRKVELLGVPDHCMFLQLVDEGAITIDHLVSQKIGDKSAVEKGPLFKIRADAREQLYTTIEKFDLLSL